MASCPQCGRELTSEGFSYCPWCATPLFSDTIEQRKTVTVVIVDLVGSTALGSSLDPEVLHDLMRTYRDSATLAVSRHGGLVAKFIGDAMVATFGAPVAHEDDAVRAVRAGADVLGCVDELNEDLRARLGVRLAVRVGINTGEVLIDHASADAGLLVGDVANVAARLENSAQPGEIRLGEATASLVRDSVDLTLLPPVLAKGKNTPVRAYVVDRVHPMGESGRRRRFSGSLVGRTEPLKRARAAFAQSVEARQCVLLTIGGAAGIGKSRLVDELLEEAAERATIVSGRCLPYGESATYWPIMQILEILRANLPWAERLNGVPHASEIARSLDALLDGTESLSGAELSWALGRLLETLASERPAVLVIDDVQWGEPLLLNLIVDLHARIRTEPLLLICIARTEFVDAHPEWGATEPPGVTIVLEPLSDASTEDLLRGLLGPALHQESLVRICEAAQGVPLFVEEFAAAITQRDTFVPADANQGVESTGMQVPASIHALLTARLDRLSKDARGVLDIAAVIGQTFYPDAIVALCGDEAGARRQLAALLDHDLIRPTITDLPGLSAYAFNHLLVRDCAYDTVPLARRSSLHESFARWLAATTTGQTQPELIATRLERAANYRARLGRTDEILNDEAARLLILCAHRARLVDDMSGSMRLLDRAAALVDPTTADAVAIMLARSEVEEKAANWSDAIEWARRAQLSAASADLDDLTWRARLQTESLRAQVDPDMNIDSFAREVDRAVAALAEIGDDRGLARAYEMRCDIDNYRGQHAQSRMRARLGIEAAWRSGDLSAVVDLMRHLMMPFYLGMGTCAEEAEAVSELQEWFRGDEVFARELLTNEMILRTHQGDLDEPMEFFTRQAVLAAEQGNVLESISKRYWLIESLEWAGDLTGSRHQIELTVALLGPVGESAMRSTQLAELAFMQVRQGLEAQARESLAASKALAQGGDYVDWVLFEIVDGLLLAREGLAAESAARFQRGHELLAPTDSWYGRRRLWLAQSLAAESLGEGEGAREAARSLLDLSKAKGWVPAIGLATERVAHCERL